ncbi:hypothetical protein DPMN_127237 [Dreissena polymorpha]|uniref:Uncharacterized protein n=1 Tax=Dreissena polymorpha TaxID=45954 RepID=A0A9D4H4V4_DREPO|nr:hypothetical protein DPMN_127237 [Dreissena polymorpha]
MFTGAPAKLPFPLNSSGRLDGSPVGGLTGDPVEHPFSMNPSWSLTGAPSPFTKNIRGSLTEVGGNQTSINI